MNKNDEIKILRSLAEQVLEISKKKSQDRKRKLWKEHNSLKKTEPLIYLQVGMWDFVGSEVITDDVLVCKDSFYRDLEIELRFQIFKDSTGDDDIIEPWISVDPVYRSEGWGPETTWIEPEAEGGAWIVDPPLKELEDIKKLVMPKHEIDEARTKENYEKAEDAIGDIIKINRRRGNAYHYWYGDVSFILGQLVGIEKVFYHLIDRPKWLHEILTFIQKGILKVYEEATNSGDWDLTTQKNQALTYAEELPDPKANSGSVGMDKLWLFSAAQEFTNVSPEMHEEFLLEYQIPIQEKFGLTAYGCCEDLTRKIGILKRVPNLRRIAVSPWADVAKCAEQIEDKYVLSWRPNPSSTICSDWNPDFIRKYITEAMEATKGCIVDLTLKDVQTVKGELWRATEWVKIVRDVCSKY